MLCRVWYGDASVNEDYVNVSLTSFQPPLTWIIVLISEAVSSFTLAALLVSLAADKLSFKRSQRQQRAAVSPTQSFPVGGEIGNGLPTHNERTSSPSIVYLARAHAVQALSSVTGCFNRTWSQPPSTRIAVSLVP
jgi:hypothetical protein